MSANVLQGKRIRNGNSTAWVVAMPSLCGERFLVVYEGGLTTVLRDFMSRKRLTIDHRRHPQIDIDSLIASHDDDTPPVSKDDIEDWANYLKFRSLSKFGRLDYSSPKSLHGLPWESME